MDRETALFTHVSRWFSENSTHVRKNALQAEHPTIMTVVMSAITAFSAINGRPSDSQELRTDADAIDMMGRQVVVWLTCGTRSRSSLWTANVGRAFK